MEVRDVVKKDKVATFSFYRQGYLYYEVDVDGISYIFPINTEDLGGASLLSEEKTVIFMRYIRKALEEGMFVLAG